MGYAFFQRMIDGLELRRKGCPRGCLTATWGVEEVIFSEVSAQ